MFARELAGEVCVARQRRVENALVFGVDVSEIARLETTSRRYRSDCW